MKKYREDVQNKIEQIENYCKLSDKKKSYYAVLEIIPEEIIMDMRLKYIGELIDNIWKSWQITKKMHEADIIIEGAVWDEKTQSMVELCLK